MRGINQILSYHKFWRGQEVSMTKLNTLCSSSPKSLLDGWRSNKEAQQFLLFSGFWKEQNKFNLQSQPLIKPLESRAD